MRLNLHILSDSLQEYKHTLISDDLTETNLVSIRHLPSDLRFLSPDYIYLTDSDSLKIGAPLKPSISFIILGEISKDFLLAMQCNAIIIQDDTITPQVVFEQVLSIFDFYNQWDSDLSGAIIRAETIQHQLDICAKVLKNPIALFDTSYVLIAKAGTIPSNYQGTVWESVLDKGHGSVEYIPREYRRIDDDCMEKHRPIVYPPFEKPTTRRFISAVLQNDNIPFAKIGMINIIVDFTLGQLSLIWHIQMAFENSHSFRFDLIATPDGTSYVLDQMLHGIEVDPQISRYFLQRQKWAADDSFFVISFVASHNNEFTQNNYQPYLFLIRQSMFFPYVTYIDKTLVAICSCKHNINSAEAVRERLLPVLTQADMLAGISMKHTGYDFLHCARMQSSNALRLGKKIYPQRNFFPFEDSYIYNIMGILGEAQDIRHFCHPTIHSILCHSNPWELELIRTLGEYLLHGKSISVTASKLFIHRNTLINRIEAIEKMLGFRVDSIDESTLQILHFSCWIAKYLAVHTKNGPPI